MNNNIQLIDINNNKDGYLNVMRRIGNEYGIHVDLVNAADEWYLVACPFTESINKGPQEILANINANEGLFITNEFAIKAERDNGIFVAEHLLEYCMKAEFVHTIFTEFEAEIPDKLREEELYALINFNEGRFDENMPYEVQHDYSVGLNKYFKKENKDGFFHKKWKEFYRSERYDEDASFLKNFASFLTRHENEIDLDLLMKSNSNVKTFEMQEKEYKEFAAYMKNLYPEVSYNVGKKTTVDHGQIQIPDGLEGLIYNPWEGVPSHWEFRKISYKAADEYKIAQVYNEIRLSYANDESLTHLQNRGDVNVVGVPLIDFMNFVSLAKANNLEFHIDTGDMATPSLDTIYVVYNTFNQEKLESIFTRMLVDKTCNYHAVSPEQVKSVQSTLGQKLEDAKQYRLNQANNHIESKNKEVER